ncbi:MAG: GNAT family N-acetyltransferase [Ruminococcaceae bacterium]|nr:GNAT family N-acetyltransferase [Oscillospiraceae bacterium]
MIIDTPQKAHAPALRALWQEAFGDSDAFLDTFAKTAFSPARCRVLLLDDAPVAGLYWFDCLCRGQRIAYLYAIATAKAFRGRGLCRALMEDTHRHLTAAGYAGAVLVPGAPTLFQLYEKMGYTVCSCVAEIAPQAAVEPAGLREIDTDTYAALRRQFLPEGGVLQEAESLAFLQAQASLYAGEHFVLAARREGASLRGLELLGDPGAAPAILTALGCSKGHFRTSGNGRPFAMYHPLDDAVPPPTYFGLAFD